MSDRLQGKVVIVSGGTRGMGEADVRGIVAHGGRVVFGGRDEEAGRTIERDLDGQGLYVPLDVTQAADWGSIVGAALDRFGTVTGLVNNAGFSVSAPLRETTDEQWAKVVAVNQTGVFLGMRAVVDAMLAAGGGSIVNIASPAGTRAHPGLVAYSAAKAAVIGMTRSAAGELASRNIRVNALVPGFFATRLLDEASRGTGREKGAKIAPMRRVAEPEEIVGATVFLLSDESGYVTGAEITVDGGLTA